MQLLATVHFFRDRLNYAQSLAWKVLNERRPMRRVIGYKALIIAAGLFSACSAASAPDLNAQQSREASTPAAASTLSIFEQKSFKTFDNFITVDGTALKDGDEDFRFISFNVPTLLYVEDEMKFSVTDPYGLPTEFELRDLYQSVADMGGQVVRAYTIPVRNENFPKGSVTYVEAPGVFNEEAFKVMDMAIALAAEYDIRLVFPLLNNWEWMGGRPNYAAFRGKTKDEFWTDPQLIADFKLTIDHVINRVNTITGVPYKDDPTIMAWETGNELENTPEWGVEIGRYIKSLDSKHLLIDGFHAIHLEGLSIWVQDYSIEEPSFDLINTHHYEKTAIETIANLKETVRRIGGKKPVFLGEYGFISTTGVKNIIDYVIGEDDIPGALIWSLRRHHKDGGFYFHSEPASDGTYRAYHWPGFPDGEVYDETAMLELQRNKGFEIQGKTPPPRRKPEPPRLLEFDGAPQFSWQGSAGASGYDIERAPNSAGPWSLIAHNVADTVTPGFALYSDETATVGTQACYRVKALNMAGISAPSNTHCVPNITHLTRVDQARNMGVLLDFEDITIEFGDNRAYKEAFSRLTGKDGSVLIYDGDGDIQNVRVYAYESKAAPALNISASEDGDAYIKTAVTHEIFVNDEKNYDYLIPTEYTITPSPEADQYIKLDFTDKVSIVRVEVDYK